MGRAVRRSDPASAGSLAMSRPAPSNAAIEVPEGRQDLCADHAGDAMHRLISELYPICRSISGNGVRKTFDILETFISIKRSEVPSGESVFDWTVPPEWNIRDAYIKNSNGKRVVDFQKSTLHVMSYSTPIRATMRLAELRPHLHSLPDRPGLIPYLTSYYAENWGFCVSHNQLIALADDDYEVCIDSSLQPGSITYGECLLPGASRDEVLISCHVCHPSLCNDNLSGIAVATALAQRLALRRTRYSYRFLFIPGTIGSIAWLARNKSQTSRIKHGLVLTCLGDSGRSTYKKSRRGNAEIDQACDLVLKQSGADFAVEEFSPYGYDERQYCSPGFNLPVGCLSRTPYGRFPEYHTSADDLTFVQPWALQDSLMKCLAVVDMLENNARYMTCNPYCEAQFGKRGLYGSIGGMTYVKDFQMALLWVMNLSDGEHTLLDIAHRSQLRWDLIKQASSKLLEHGLLRPADAPKIAGAGERAKSKLRRLNAGLRP